MRAFTDDRLCGQHDGMSCAIIHAPRHVVKTVSDLVKGLGGKFHEVP